MTQANKSSEKSFYSLLWTLVLPITIQGLVNQAVNTADVFMLGCVGQDSLSAVSLANQIQFLTTGFFWGATGGTSLMVAQYFGKRDMSAIESVMGIGVKVSLVFTTGLALAAVLFPVSIMRLFTNETALVGIGADYLRVIAITYVLQSFSQIYECAMRSIGRAGISTAISSAALAVNVVLNAAFIFGWLGLPRLGVIGVAAATVIARSLEVVLCMLDAAKNDVLRPSPRRMLRGNPVLRKDFFRYSAPALFNDLSWTVAFSTYSIILGHLGSDVVAAAAVATTVRDLSTVVCMSLGSAAVTILGQEIGAGDTEAARRDGRRILVLSVVTGVITGVIILLVSPLLPHIFRLSETSLGHLRFMMLVSSYYVIGQSVNTAIITGIFRAGGDTKFGMWCDTINMWCIAVPVGFLCAFVLKLPPNVVYFVLCLDEFYKIPVEYIHYRKYTWLRNVTRTA